MTMILSGNGNMTGLVSGGLPDGTVLPADLSTGGPYWDTSGKLGVGTSSPGAKLHTYSATGATYNYVQTGDGSNAGIRLKNSVGEFYLLDNASGAFDIYDATAAASRLTIDSSGNLRFNSGYGSVATAYGCRAWVNFNGQGTVAIRASGNVSSITDNGTGDYYVNFTTAMPDANYAINGANNWDNGSINLGVSVTNQAASSTRVSTPYGTNNVRYDPLMCYITVFR